MGSAPHIRPTMPISVGSRSLCAFAKAVVFARHWRHGAQRSPLVSFPAPERGGADVARDRGHARRRLAAARAQCRYGHRGGPGSLRAAPRGRGCRGPRRSPDSRQLVRPGALLAFRRAGPSGGDRELRRVRHSRVRTRRAAHHRGPSAPRSAARAGHGILDIVSDHLPEHVAHHCRHHRDSIRGREDGVRLRDRPVRGCRHLAPARLPGAPAIN